MSPFESLFSCCLNIHYSTQKEKAMHTKQYFLLAIVVSILSPFAIGQAHPQDDALFQTVHSLDEKLFDAYNHCDIATLGTMVSDDLEFYHDQTGLSLGKASFLKAVKQNICGKVERTLLTKTLEVYPLKGYGAVEIGIHRFHHPGRPQDGMGDAKFVTLWQNKDGVWTVTRVISYEHNEGLLTK
jgi:ketosteroid isomerase-like protein